MATTLLHAITFLLNPLPTIYSTHVLDALHVALLSNLSHSESHSLFLAPNAPPPQPIAQALRTVPVNWDDWVLRLTRGNILVLAIDLQRGTVVVAIRNPATSATSRTVLWDSRSNTSRANSPWGSSSSSSRSSSPVSSRVVTPEPLIAVSTAENVLKDWDTHNDEIVYPSPRRHAKSASTSVIKPAVHDLSSTLATLTLDSPPLVPSDSEEDEPCYIDKTKDQAAVTEYECGKVGVLTGAVMLGVPKNNPKAVKHQPRRSRHAHSHSVTAEFSHLPRI